MSRCTMMASYMRIKLVQSGFEAKSLQKNKPRTPSEAQPKLCKFNLNQIGWNMIEKLFILNFFKKNKRMVSHSFEREVKRPFYDFLFCFQNENR